MEMGELDRLELIARNMDHPGVIRAKSDYLADLFYLDPLSFLTTKELDDFDARLCVRHGGFEKSQRLIFRPRRA